MNSNPNYLAEENFIALKAKKCDPDLKVVPGIAVYEFLNSNQDRTIPLPSAEWIKETGLKTLEYDFDGIMFYPWNPNPNYMGKTIKDIANDEEYRNAFQEVFREAKK
ncbi:MAG: hypothetical protein ABIA76_06160 [Candidatus Diapherotrites archaeon]